MIQPVTIVTFLLACGSGLYLYQSKHEVQLLDRTIERAVHDTGALREQSRLLAAEWTILNDPERLRRFSDTYLKLKTIAPTQFTSVADLGSRLPPPHADAAPDAPDQPDAIAAAPESVPLVPEPAPVADEVLPVPPKPAMPPAPVAAPAARPADVKTVVARPASAESQAHTIVTDVRPPEVRPPEVRPPEPRPSEARVTEARTPEARAKIADARPDSRSATGVPSVLPPAGASGSAAGSSKPASVVASKPAPAIIQAPSKVSGTTPSHPAVVATSEPYNGSLLGMAHSTAPSSVPRPTPVIATYNAN